MQSTRPYLIIDADNHLYRAYWKFSKMKSGDQSTAALFGMPRIVSSIIRKLQPKETYLVWDGFKDKRRLAITPSYKDTATRVQLGYDKEQVISQKALLMEMFGYLGIPQLHNPSIEGDDHSYMLARKLRSKGKTVVIASSDKDFRQLLSKNLYIWDDQRNIKTTHKNCKDLHGYSNKECVDWLCLFGDKSDNLKGYPGMGEVKTTQFLNEHGSIKGFLNQQSLTFRGIDRVKLIEIYGYMREMTDLKYFYLKNIKGNRKVTFINERKDINLKRYRKMCESFGLSTHQSEKFIKSFE